MKRAALLLLPLIVGGCTSHQRIRELEGPLRTSLAEVRRASASLRCELHNTSIEVYDDGFSLGVIELSDDGHFKDERQRKAVMDHITSELKDGGILVTFIHGWHHTAGECDPNLACFREALRGIRGMQDLPQPAPKGPKRVVGLYVGWRGESVRLPSFVSFTSFYERKAIAHHIGEGAGRDLLLELDDFYRDTRRRLGEDKLTMITVGHSFGAALTYSALESLRLREYDSIHRAAPQSKDEYRSLRVGLGDLVVLVNPAFEALRYVPFAGDYGIDLDQPYLPDQRTRLITVASGRDRAVGVAFPIGRTLWILGRPWRYRDFTTEVTGHGRYAPHVTYDLTATPTAAVAPAASNANGASGETEQEESSCGCESVQEVFGSAGSGTTEPVIMAGGPAAYRNGAPTPPTEGSAAAPTKPCVAQALGGVTLTPRRGADCVLDMPFAVIHTDRTVIPGHSDIFNRVFMEFLAKYVRTFLAREQVGEYR